MNIVLRIVISAIVAFALSYILSGVHIQSFVTALILAIVLGLLKPVCQTHPHNSHSANYHIYFWPVSVCYKCPDYFIGCEICQRIQRGWFLVGIAVQSSAVDTDFFFYKKSTRDRKLSTDPCYSSIYKYGCYVF